MPTTNYDSSQYDLFSKNRVLAGYRYVYQNKVDVIPRGEINGTSAADTIVSRYIGNMDLFRDNTAVTTGFLTYLNSLNTNVPTPDISATAGNGVINVAFISEKTGFIVNITDVLSSVTLQYIVAANIASFTTIVGDVTNGRQYSVSVIAVSGGVFSEPTAPVLVRPLAPPPTPIDLIAVSANESTTLSWTLPAADPYITHYLIYELGTTSYYLFAEIPVGQITGNTYTITGLTNGIQYVFNLKTRNINGALSSGQSNDASVIPIGQPGIPGSVQITSANNAVTITWGRASSETAVVGYEVDVSLNGAVVDTRQVLVSAGAMTITYSAAGINGLPAQGIVRSYNSVYQSTGVSSSVIIVRPPPSVTAISSVESQDGACIVNWNSFDPASTYTDSLFVVAMRKSDSVVVSTQEVTPITLTSKTISGLTNGVAYLFTLRATNSSSPVPSTSAAIEQTPYPVPPVVTGVSATPGNGVATISWTLPVITTFISTFDVDISAGGFIIRTDTLISKNETSWVVNGLTNNVLYNFYVRSVNPRTSATAASAGSAIPRGIPGAVTGLVGFELDGAVDISWAQVSGLDVDGYRVSYKRNGTADTETFLSDIVGSSSRTALITGLTNGVAYDIRVRAYNNISVGTAGLITKTPLPTPVAPTGVQAFPGIQSIDVSWNASVTPSTFLSGYKLYVSAGGSPVTGSPFTLAKTLRTFKVEGLTPNVEYSAALTATNTRNVLTESGLSSSSSATAYAAPEGAPTIIAADASNARILLQWDISPGDITPNFSAFEIEVARVDTGATYVLTISDVDARSYDIGSGVSGNPPLENNVIYRLAIRQRNPIIAGPWSGNITRKPLDHPPVVTGLTATAGQAAVVLNWTRPITLTYVYDYLIDVSAGGAPLAGMPIVVSDEALQTRTITGLQNGVEHAFTIRSRNDIFTSAAVGPVFATPLAEPPAVSITDLSAGDAFVGVRWSVTDDTYVSFYDISLVNVGSGLDVSSARVARGVSGFVFSGVSVVNGTSYKVRISARNAVTSGVTTLSTASVTPKPPPPAPAAISAVAGIGTIAVSWSEPAVTTYVSSYYVQMYEGGIAKGSEYTFSPGTTSRTFTTAASEITNGLLYYFTIRSANEWYSSASVTSASVRPLSKPAAITGLSVDASSTRVIVRWNAVGAGELINTERLRILYDVATASPFTRELVVSDATSTTIDVSGLVNQTLYGFRMRGENSLSGGNGDYTSVVESRPRDRVGTIAVTSLVAGNSVATIDWDYSGPAGSVDYYRIIATPVGGGSAVQNDIYTIGTTIHELGLVNGVEYSVTIQGFNTIPEFSSPVISAGSVTPLGKPADVTGFAVDPSNASVSCSWTPSSDGLATTGYEIEYIKQTLPVDISRLIVNGRAVGSVVISGLVNNALYDFRIRGFNPIIDPAVGYGNWTDPYITAIKPRGLPIAPVPQTLVAGVGEATFTWAHGGSADLANIDSYIIDAVTGGTTITYDISRGGGSVLPTSAVLGGLINGSTYVVSIYAKNNLFSSVAASGGSVTPLAKPAAVTGLVADPSNARVIVSWNAATDGFTTRYKLRWSTAEAPLIYSYQIVDAPAVSTEITGLDNNLTYGISIIGKNAVTEGIAYSTAVNVIPRGVPIAPVGSGLTAGVGEATLTWTQGGSVAELANIDSYVIYARASGGVEIQFTAAKADRSAVLGGLTNGVTYSVSIKSINNIFASVEASAGSVIPLAIPAAVTGVAVDASDTRVIVRWSAATDGFTDGYDISYSQNIGGAKAVRIGDVGSGTRHIDISGVTNGALVNVSMRGYNAVANGPYSAAVSATPRGRPVAPSDVVLTAGNSSIAVTWTSSGGADIDNYGIIYTSGGGSGTSVTISNVGGAAVRTYTITGLVNGETYSVGVYAYNPVFSSSVVSGGNSTPLGPPATPVLSGTATTGSVTLTWTMSSVVDISGYIVRQGGVEVARVLAGTQTATISSLTNGVGYSFVVVAYNTNNTPSALSNEVALKPMAIPLAPTSLTGLADISEVVLDWVIASGPSDPPVSDLESYIVNVRTGGAVIEVIDISRTGVVAAGFTFNTLRRVRLVALGYNYNGADYTTTLTYQVSGLANGTDFSFNMVTRNANGDTSPSSSSVTARPLAAPPVPTITSLRGRNAAFDVAWTLPSSYGETNISGSSISYSMDGVMSGTLNV